MAVTALQNKRGEDNATYSNSRADGKIKDMVPESDVALLELLDIEEEEEHMPEQPAQTVPAAPTPAKPRSLADMLPPEPGAQATQPAPAPLPAQAKAQTLFVTLFVIVALVGGMQFLQPRSASAPVTPPTATIAGAAASVAPTSTPAPTALAYAAPDGAQLGPVSLAGLPAPIGRYGSTDWLYFEFAKPIGSVWLRASDLGIQVDPTLKDMQPVPTAVPAPWSPPAAPAWTDPLAESAPASEQPTINAPDLHQQPQGAPEMTPVPPRAFQDEVAAAALDPAGETENAIKKILNPGNGCLKNKATGETICS